MRFYLCLFLLLAACASNTQYAVQRPFLYEVTKGDQKGYLFGTMHIGVTDEDLPESFWPYFESSDAYAFEDDLAVAQSNANQYRDLIVQKDPQKKLRNLMNPSDYAMLEKALMEDDPKRAPFILENFTPFGALIALNLIVSTEQSQSSKIRMSRGEAVRMQSQFMLDLKLIERAQKSGRAITYLDAHARRLITECKIGTEQEHLNEISKLLNSPTRLQDKVEKYREMVQIYRSGDAVALRNWIPPDEPGSNCILTQRNQRWMNSILGLLEAYQSPFIAVGAGHLESTQGSLIELLSERGYQIRRVEMQAP